MLSLLPSDNGWMDKNVIISSDVKRRSIASSVWYITAGNGGGGSQSSLLLLTVFSGVFVNTDQINSSVSSGGFR